MNCATNIHGRGLSRAAKKRVKKKEKENHQHQHQHQHQQQHQHQHQHQQQHQHQHQPHPQHQHKHSEKTYQKQRHDEGKSKMNGGLADRHETNHVSRSKKRKFINNSLDVIVSQNLYPINNCHNDDVVASPSLPSNDSDSDESGDKGGNVLAEMPEAHLQIPPNCTKLIDLVMIENDISISPGINDGSGAEKIMMDKQEMRRYISTHYTTSDRVAAILLFLLGATLENPAGHNEGCDAATPMASGQGVSMNYFYARYWEKRPYCYKPFIHTHDLTASSPIKRNDQLKVHRHRLDGFLSLQTMRDLLMGMSDTIPFYYGKDLNVTRYETDSKGIKRRVSFDLVKSSPLQSKNIADSINDPCTESNDDDLYVRVDPQVLWSQYEHNCCTIRLLRPQEHIPAIHSLLSLLELEWGCMVGANAYLTPPGQSQGFAPHYDDIDAFILQLEGYKRWKVYAPLDPVNKLPRISSHDFTPTDLLHVTPVLDVVLGPGDVLYMPRGWIHEATTLPSREVHGHSLHLTVSAMQQWAWADLMEIVVPQALEAAIQSDSNTSLREGLPRNFLEYMGTMHDNREENVPEVLRQQGIGTLNEVDETMTPQEVAAQTEARLKQKLQENFRQDARKRLARVTLAAMEMINIACDELSKRFIADRLPPLLTEHEKYPVSDEYTNMDELDSPAVKGSSSQKEKKASKQQPKNNDNISLSTMCRLVRPGIARLVLEPDDDTENPSTGTTATKPTKAVLYHCMMNSLMYRGTPLTPLEFELDDGPALEQLLTTLEPHWIQVRDLYHDTDQDRIGVTQALYDEGLLAILAT
jgi:bifunctional lysine-specific demethylase and histidyl-hydroxylase NO66